MKKSTLISALGIFLLSLSLNANTINNTKEIILPEMTKYSYYCDGIWSGYIWASSEAQAYAIAVKKCN